MRKTCLGDFGSGSRSEWLLGRSSHRGPDWLRIAAPIVKSKGAQFARHAPPKNHSGVNAARRGMTSPAAVILVRNAEKNMRCAKDLEKSESQFGLPLTLAIERRFRRLIPLAYKTPDAEQRSGGAGAVLKAYGGRQPRAADRGGAPGGAARPQQTIPARERSVARAAPGARAGGNIRPRGAAHDSGASRRSISVLGLLGFAWRSVA